jgi:1,4-alpha-glucan branching enzyme
MLTPFAPVIERRHDRFTRARAALAGGSPRVSDQCNSHLHFGLHRDEHGWIFREWAPAATAIYLVGPFSDWREDPAYALSRAGDEEWEIHLPEDAIEHGTLYRLLVKWDGGQGERLPTHARRAVQDEYTKQFSAQAWMPPRPYRFKHAAPATSDAPLVYEAHVGMSTEHRRVSTFTEFRLFVLPRVVDLGYNTIQLMGIQEHPYYGSFGYQVSNFFAVSSRFGTPAELQQLVDTAHGMGLRVVMDLVHSHAVSNEAEGLGKFDGTETQFFHAGERGRHPLWRSRCFDYGKTRVTHFLLSNCKYWLEEFHLDGFRFDGITSMIYTDHGIHRDFTAYDLYFDGQQDEDAITYLKLANEVIREVNPNAITIAEEMSGMPGMAFPVAGGGFGFDYRMSMGVPDYWIRLIEEKRDEEWHVGDMFHELTRGRVEERTISYAESHDQAMVGDKTIFHRLVDKEVYEHMSVSSTSLVIDRGIALHEMIRLLTIGTAGNGYLTFMGNEWGHPGWIDFPREGNGWSYDHARRLWSLVDDDHTRFRFMNAFDREMIRVATRYRLFDHRAEVLTRDNEQQVLAFTRGELLFVFNFNPTRSLAGYEFEAPAGKYTVTLNTDRVEFGGFGRVDESVKHFTRHVPPRLSLYLPARSGMVLERC